MLQVSVVIIAKNEAENIVACINSAKQLSNDIIVIDTGSKDQTIALAQNQGAHVVSIPWINYGHARNTGAKSAAADWILAIDADERITAQLASNVKNADIRDFHKVYGFARNNFFGTSLIRYGPLAHDRVFRLYNRTRAEWTEVQVHEKLTGDNLVYCMLDADAEHYGNRNPEHYLQKKIDYAHLWAIKQQQVGKKPEPLIRVASTMMSFIKAYFIQLGFLDFKYGLRLAKINAYYTWLKYGLLKNSPKQNFIKMKEKANHRVKGIYSQSFTE